MDATWSTFLFQTTPSQPPTDATIQAELLPDLTGTTHSPPVDAMAEAPPSTVDTAALNEDPVPPVKPVVSAAGGRVTSHVCSTCGKSFKNGYNLRRHQSVHTGVRTRDRAARGGGGAGPGGGGTRQTIPLSLLQLTQPSHTPTATAAVPTVTMVTAQPLTTAVVVAGTMVQVSENAVLTQASSSTSVGDDIGVGMVTATPTTTTSNTGAAAVRKNHACEVCAKAFRDVYHLNRHRLSHSDEKPFTCPICQQRFKRKDRMSYHVRSHTGGVEKPYVCPHCAKGFSRPDHLNSHVRQVHSTERPFKCPTCESAFATKDRLRAHLIRHEDKVPCHVCGKLLSPAYITDHMRVHNQSQHHVCHLCNRTFTTLTYLRVHAQKHHGTEWKEGGALGGVGGVALPGRGPGGVLRCHLCGILCRTPTQLQGHMGTHGDPSPSPSPGQATPTTTSDPVPVTPVTPVTASISIAAGNGTISLLVTDCSSITPQTQS